MLKSFAAGLLVLLVLGTIAFFTENRSFFQSAALVLGLAAFAGAGLLSNAFVSGDRARSNLYAEDNGDRRSRQKWIARLFFFGLPLTAAALVSFRLF